MTKQAPPFSNGSMNRPAPFAAEGLSTMPATDTVRAVAITPSRPGDVKLVAIAIPPPATGEVEIDVIRVGVCGTDRELIRGEIGHPPAGSDDLILGHEVVGAGRMAVPPARPANPTCAWTATTPNAASPGRTDSWPSGSWSIRIG